MSWHCSSISFLREFFFLAMKVEFLLFLLPLWETCVTNQSLCATEGPPLKLIMFFTDAYGKCHIRFVCFFFPAMLCSMWDVSYPTREWTHVPCIGSAVLTTGLPGKSSKCISERINEKRVMRIQELHFFLYNEYTTTYLNFQAYFHHFIHFSITLLILPEDNF